TAPGAAGPRSGTTSRSGPPSPGPAWTASSWITRISASSSSGAERQAQDGGSAELGALHPAAGDAPDDQAQPHRALAARPGERSLGGLECVDLRVREDLERPAQQHAPSAAGEVVVPVDLEGDPRRAGQGGQDTV